MKIAIFLLPFVIFSKSSFSQNLYDKYWMVGLSGTLNLDTKAGAVILDFTTDPPTQTAIDPKCGLAVGPNLICDEKGVPQLYSNGCCVLNANRELLFSGDSINYPGETWDAYCFNCGDYSKWLSGFLILPSSSQKNEYYMFHMRQGGNNWYDEALLYSTIDMNAKNGHGAVTKKNIFLVSDSLADGITAVRHGNGRDWWIFQGTMDNDKTHLFLLDPSGVHGPFTDHILGLRNTYLDPPGFFGYGYSTFSPNGTQFARIDGTNGLQIANFDRCTGKFSCPLNIPFKGGFRENLRDFADQTYVNGNGLEYSPNGRFLYVSTGFRLFQFDMKAVDISNSWEIVGQFDENDPLSAPIFQGELAINNKIYWTASGDSYAGLHVIHKPDLKGKACEFKNLGLQTPIYIGFNMGIYPNFRLYDWANSPCDTIGINNPDEEKSDEWASFISIAPNPADEKAEIRIPHACENPEIKLFDVSGRFITNYGRPLGSENLEIDLTILASGTYFVSLFSGRKNVETVKLIVMHN